MNEKVDRAAGPVLDKTATRLGLPSATALVIGSIIGTGVFTMPAVMAGAGTSSILTLGVIAVGARAARRDVRPADQAGPEHRRRPVRIRPARVRRLRRLPHGLVLLDHLLGRQRRDRVVVGAVRRVVVRHQQPEQLDELRHRDGRSVDPGGDQPRRRQADGVVPERHRRSEVRAAAARRRRRLVLRPVGELRSVQRLRRQPLQRHRHRRRRRVVLVHRRRDARRSRRAGSKNPRRNVGRASADRHCACAACSTSR